MQKRTYFFILAVNLFALSTLATLGFLFPIFSFDYLSSVNEDMLIIIPVSWICTLVFSKLARLNILFWLSVIPVSLCLLIFLFGLSIWILW
jgi:hypothetical protein